jgi:hypothetical protein
VMFSYASMSFLLLALVGCGGGGGGGNAANNNTAPVANAGIVQNVVAGTLVTLNGSASSDANGDPLTYSWTLTSKPTSSTATLASATSAAPTFTTDLAGSYVATLVVNDSKINSTASTITVTASVANAAPVANAGAAQNVTAGTLVTLNGSASSDANGDPLTYSWTLTSKPIGSAATLTGATTVQPSFTPDISGYYWVWLTVNDGKVNSAASVVSIFVTVAASAASTTSYNVSATRIGQNFYQVDPKWIIQTKYCYEYASSESATLVMTAFTGSSDGTITFASGASCTVAGAYYPMNLSAGTYSAYLSVEGDGFYTDSLQQVVVRSNYLCLVLLYLDKSTLSLTYGGLAYSSGLKIGTITFSDNRGCDLIGIYKLSKLN